nr:hypothetical protein GCM10020063_036720 [Dactylosporangium thailandense]
MLRTELIRPITELLREHGRRFGAKAAFRDARRAVTYGELERRTFSLAGNLAALGLGRGDRAVIYLGNRVETVESYLALVRAAAIGVPLNPRSTDSELQYLLEDSGAVLVITDDARVDQVRRVAGDRRIVLVGEDFEALATTGPAAPPPDDLALDEPAWMLYTSGTTGRPKGVLSTQASCLYSVAACYVPIPGLSADDRVVWPLPLFHSLSHIACVLSVTAVGATARIVDGLSADDVLAAVREDAATFLAGVPTLYHYLVEAARESGFVAPDLRMCLVGGAITTAALRRAFDETFGVPLLDAYGSTETCGSIAVNRPTGPRVEGSCGLPVPGVEVRLVDPETGEDVPAGVEGEVWVRGPSVMLGYHNQPEATAAALRDGWYHTGDLAHRDEAGHLTVAGRLRELIIRGGENIHPAEIEEALRGVPGVADVAATGRPHEALGEVPVAFVVPGPEGVDPAALLAAARERLSYFKVPEELYAIAAVPRTASGKVTRLALLDRPARLLAVAGGQHDRLLLDSWTELGPARPEASPQWTAVLADGAGAPPTPEHVRAANAALRAHVEHRLAAERLVIVTRGAVSALPGEPIHDPVYAPAWSWLRLLQAEHPDRLRLLDLEPGTDPAPLIVDDEPQVAVRGGVRRAPRLVPARSTGAASAPLGPLRVIGAGTALSGHLEQAYALDGTVPTVVVAVGGDADEAWRIAATARDVPAESRLIVLTSLAGLRGSAADADLVAAEAYARGIAARHPNGLALAGDPSTREGRALFDAALLTGATAATAWPTGATPTGPAAALLRRGPAGVPRPRSGDEGALRERLRGQPAVQRRHTLRQLVHACADAVLPAAHGTDADRPFKALGFTSLQVVQLRDRIRAETGLALPSTLAFDYPTPALLAEHLAGLLLGSSPAPAADDPAPAAAGEPVAIVAMGCRLPGGVSSPDELWDLVARGGDAIGEFPADRGWDLARLRDGASATQLGGFLYDAADFDAEFFGISPREALAMDPQQRLLLETSWETVERAGIDPGALRGSPTGVFFGVMHHDYAAGVEAGDLEGYLGTGTAGSVASGRVAYALGLEGPAISVDTACSSSLVSLHLAAQALRAGECSLALAGGVAVMASPQVFVEFSRQRGLSPDGRCKAFAQGADGTAWSEGVAVLLLERLSDAQRLGHPVLAVLRGSAINQDGASNGLTAPSGPAQQRVIRRALAGAGLTAADVDAVEAHGTGTRLGDPIEAQALIATYGQGRDTPLWLGSLKSNIGHVQAAAGAAGVIKMVLAMRHGVLPRTIHVDEPTREVDWSAGAVRLLTEAREWPDAGRPRRAAVSSFGVSGTNAHVILESPPDPVPAPPAEPPAEPQVDVLPWLLSAASPEGLRAQAGRLLAWADGQPAADIGFSLATTRAALTHRAVVAGGDRDGLAALAADRPAPGLLTGAAEPGRLAVLFTGQGSQRAGMGRELYERFPVYAAAFDEACALLDPRLADVVRDGSLLDQTEFTQAGLFALEVALFRLLASWGVTPDVVGGHSVGELAAAHAAGILSLPDAARLVTARGRLMQALPAGGAMVAVEAAEDEVAPLLSERVSIAALNGPRATVISGDEDAVLAVATRLRAEGRRTRRLQVSHAFHSARMDPMLDALAEVAAGLTVRPAELALVSNVTGAVADAGLLADPRYWSRHAREAVRFLDGVRALPGLGVTTVLEVGPGGVLTALGPDCDAGDLGFVAALRDGGTEVADLLAALGRLHVRGVPVDWAALHEGRGRRVPLPTYAFQRTRFWLPETGPAERRGGLYEIGWAPVPPGTEPATLLRAESAADGPLPQRARETGRRVLAAIQRWLTDHDHGRLVIAVDPADPAQATVPGLVHCAQAEHPGRFGLLEAGTDPELPADEPWLAVRDGRLLAARLRPLRGGGGHAPKLAGGAVLVTGGTGGLGRLVAAHLAAEYGVAELVLVSRRGTTEPWVRELSDTGVRVRVVAGDVADRATLAAAIEPVRDRLVAVVHAAGVVDDAVVANLGDERWDPVLRPKVDGAWHLHELTAGLDLAAFVLFSSASSTLGGPGQGNYAAANTFLDALAAHRRALGLPATTIAWGLWEQAAGMGGRLRDVDVARAARAGTRALSDAAGLHLLDAALRADRPHVIAMDLDHAALDPGAALLRELAPAVRQDDPLVEKLRAMDADEGTALLLDLVRTNAAVVLGHAGPDRIVPARAFKDAGFDSLMAVELGQRLSAGTGLRLPGTTIFNHPTPLLLAGHLRHRLLGDAAATTAPDAPHAATGEPIAIVAMACRFPGGVGSPEQLWDLVAAGGDAIGPVPADRGWDLDAIFDPEPGVAGRTYVRSGGFLDGVADFDAGFFGISPREAIAMDPQQRHLLEVAWEALERAGLDATALAASRTGVFVGTHGQDYAAQAAGGDEADDGHLLTGSSGSVLSGRVAYALGLEGPAVTVDTACSSSLVALHLAAQSLRLGECELALAGGVSFMSSPSGLVGFSRQRGLSPDGRCRAFSDAADGFGMAEGAGLVVLERLSEARRLGHPVLAVVRGSAVNSDGASNGLTAPNGPSQERVIRQALASAGLTPADVDAVEAHGTGTPLGDPIEAQALIATYGQERPAPVLLGSVKSNIGHTQAAAGIAGVMKMVLAMRAGIVPATLHADTPTSHVDWSAGAVELATEARPWPSTGPRRAGVSSFGISGTNAHVIIEHVPAPEPPEQPAAEPEAGTPVPWTLSARTPDGLAAQARRLHARLGTEPGLHPRDVAHTLLGRAALEHRATIVGGDLMAGLASLADGTPSAAVALGRAEPPARGAVFVFPGQGSQWTGMAAELLDTSPVFAERMAQCAAALAPHVEWSLDDVVRGRAEPGLLERVDVVQPALFAMMVSLVEVWRSLGVEPAAVIGHSQGEIAAACVAGALSLEDAAMVVARRSRALAALAGGGGMVSLPMPADEVRAHLVAWDGRLSIAAVNGPGSVVVAGEAEAVEELLAGFDGRARRIPVDYASHSPAVQRIEADLLDALAGVRPRRSELAFYSTVEAAWADTSTLDAAYWYRNLRRPVEFHRSVEDLLDQGYRVFVEASPHPVLTRPIADTAEAARRDDAVATGTLRRDDGGLERVLRSAADLHVRGVRIDWPVTGRLVDLPTYAFDHRRYWPTTSAGTGDVAAAGLTGLDHPLLTASVTVAGTDGLLLTGRVSRRLQPWLADHVVLGRTLVPGTAFVELAVRAGDELGFGALDELVVEAPLTLDGDAAVRLQVAVAAPDDTGRRPVTVHSRPADARPDDPWTRHAAGLLAPSAPAPGFDLATWPPLGARPADVEQFYPRQAEAGYEYGPAFQGLRAVWIRGDEVFAEAELHAPAAGFGLHPALLDAALHAATFAGVGRAEPGRVMLPFAWSGVALHATGATTVRVRAVPAGEHAMSVQLADEAGAPVAAVTSLALRPAAADSLGTTAPGVADSLFVVDWTPLPRTAVPAVSAAATTVHIAADTAADTPARARLAAAAALARVQEWLDDPAADASTLVVATEHAVATRAGEPVDAALATVWGLLRSAQTEHPDRFVLLDLDRPDALDGDLLDTVLAAQEPQLAVRGGQLFAPRLARAEPGPELVPPPGTAPWRLDSLGRGTLENLALVPHDPGLAPLGPTEVRVALRAAGVNFRDVLNALGMYPGDAGLLGGEGAGVVTEVGAGVSDLRPGDRVLGVFDGSFATLAVTERGLLVPVPPGWDWARAAATPVVFLTAAYGLFDLAALRPGEAVLVHAGAGGVGMAAIGLARARGAEVYATASPDKWPVLRELGLDEDHIASSRTLEFEDRFLAATGGRGVDVVLNSLAGDFVDASLRLLPRGGRFVEMGKTDRRDPGEVAARHPGVDYRAFETADAGVPRLQELLLDVVDRLDRGELRPLPVASWDVRRAPDAFRHLSQARHVGKVVLTLPRPLDPDGTVLITGGTGLLGGLVAERLVTGHGIRSLVLGSRQGPGAPAAAELRDRLSALGAEVTVVAGDVADPAAVAAMLAAVPAGRPLTAVVHAAGRLDDAPVTALNPGRLDAVFGPKLDGAWHLHEQTRDLDLAEFVVFSSGAGIFGVAGQANYAAANAFTDALAADRRAAGRPARALAWGLWEQPSAMTAGLGEIDRARAARAGLLALPTGLGLDLFDAALRTSAPLLVPTRLDLAALRRLAAGVRVPALLGGLVARRPAARPTAGGPAGAAGLADRLAGLPASVQLGHLLELVRAEAAAVLGHGTAEDIDPVKAFSQVGFDSLTAVELRNRLTRATAVRLPATLIYDHPDPTALARHLQAELVPVAAAPEPSILDELDRLERASVDPGLREAVAARLEALAARWQAAGAAEADVDLDQATDDELFALIDDELGLS